MPLTIVDGRPPQYQGDLNLATLTAIIHNSVATTYAAWDAANKTVTITKGAHQGAWYPPPENTDYYFDVKVNGDPREWHSLLTHPADNASVVLANV